MSGDEVNKPVCTAFARIRAHAHPMHERVCVSMYVDLCVRVLYVSNVYASSRGIFITIFITCVALWGRNLNDYE